MIKQIFFPVVIIILGFLNINCGNKSDATNKTGLTALNEVPVQVTKVQKKDFNVSRNFSGTLEGEEQANIVAKIQERIMTINVKVGDKVKPGQLILSLDKAGASSQYFQAKAGYENAKQNLERMKSLYDVGAIAKQMLDGAQTTYDISLANFEAAKSMVELVSPIAGIVTFVDGNTGDLSMPGKVIATIASINNMKISFNVNEVDIPNIAVGKSAEIYSDQRAELIQKGKISQISNSADVQSRTFEVKAAFPNTPDKWFKPGMFCRVNVQMNSVKGSLLIPTKALVFLDSKRGVFVAENNKASFRTVDTGLSNDESTEILSGLKEGETVITIGMNNLRDGSVVRIME